MKKVLIIEDDMDTLELLGVLASQSNNMAVLRSDVLSIAEIEQIKPDLILLDHWLGSHLGGNLCKEIKENYATQDIPIVMISALLQIGTIAFDSHADGCLTKPFDLQEIEGVFESYLA